MTNINIKELEKIIKNFTEELTKFDLHEDKYCKDILSKMNNYLRTSKINKEGALHCLRSNVQELCLERAATCNVNDNNIYTTSRKARFAHAFSQ